MESRNNDTVDLPCLVCCDEGCPYFFRYDICSPENSTYFLDIYADIVERNRRDSFYDQIARSISIFANIN